MNRVFRPSEEEVAYARRVVQAFEEALARGEGAVQVDGRAVDTPVAKRARALIELAEAIEATGAVRAIRELGCQRRGVAHCSPSLPSSGDAGPTKIHS